MHARQPVRAVISSTRAGDRDLIDLLAVTGGSLARLLASAAAGELDPRVVHPDARTAVTVGSWTSATRKARGATA